MVDIFVSRFAAEEAEASGFAALGFDAKAFLIQLITFLLVFYILKRFVFGRVVDLLEKRRLTIEEGVKLTSQLQTEKEKLDAEIVKIERQARTRADEVIAASKNQASQILQDAEEAAQKKIDVLMSEANKKIEEEIQIARRKIEDEAVDLVIKATEVVTDEKLDKRKDQALISRALKEQV
jgi:F-type H+-transporting ATPase subunit b